MRIVFFTNPWASAKIRGEQIAARLENSLVVTQDDYAASPTNVCKDDVCVFVKCSPDQGLADMAKQCYVDVVDSTAALSHITDLCNVKVIAIGVTSHKYISEYLGRDDIILIPEHHCNFKNELRDRPKVERVGFCGYTDNFHLPFGEVSNALASIDVEFVYETQVEDRQNVCSFYKYIDVQLCFRKSASNAMLKNPLKLANAGSFRIPTIAYPEPSYVAEWDGAFAKVDDLAQIVRTVKILKESTAAYDNLADAALKKAQEYHIDKIIPLYKGLLV